MKPDEASSTAAWVAAARSAGALLPRPLQLADDPYGVRFASGPVGRITRFALRHPRLGRAFVAKPGPLHAFLLWMQLRTRTLDDIVRAFAQSGGRQLVLLGAGYDCRAYRLPDAVSGALVVEVDHPATQRRKRALAPSGSAARVRYVAWNFEIDGLQPLPDRLAQEGLDPSARTLTLWEGVTNYLTEASIDETVRVARRFGAQDSWLAFSYLDRRALERPRGDAKLTARLVSQVGEPYRFGWDPAALPAWLAQRRYALRADHDDRQLAARHFPARAAAHFRGDRHTALAATC